MIFRLYDAASGGVPLWEEQWTGSNGVAVSDGLFNVMLGSLTAIPENVITGNGTLWLGITVGTDDEMTPRVQLGSVPFAVQALTVPDGSVTTAKIADGAVTSAKAAPTIVVDDDETAVDTTSTAWSEVQRITVTVDTPSNLFIWWQSHVTNGTANAGGNFMVRLDGMPTDGNTTLRTHYTSAGAGTIQPINIVGTIGNVAPGTHTVEVWWNMRGGTLLRSFARQLGVIAFAH